MGILDSIFDGLLGYEKLMLLCGLVLFVFALAAIAVLIAKGRDFKAATLLFAPAIVLMGYPGIQSVKFSQDTVELDRIRAQPQAPTDPAQKQQAQQVLANLEQRAAGNVRLQAQVSDGYRAIGELDKAYRLAQSVLEQKPSAQVQATLVPVLTAKLNEVQAGAPVAAPRPATAESSATGASAVVPAPDRQREIAAIAGQLQATAAPLPAASHVALAKAYAVLGQPEKAQANVEAARRLDPNIKINAAVLRETDAGGAHQPAEP